MRPEVSVVIPAYAAAATIDRAVGSALSGGGPSAEVVLVADDDLDYAALLSARSGERLRILRTKTPRSGASAARNQGVAAAEGDLIAYLDADDFYPPDRLARLAPLARERGASAGPCVGVEEGGAYPGTADHGAVETLSFEMIVGSRRSFSPVVRRDCAGLWRPVRFAEDMIYNAELHARAPDYAYDPCAGYAYVQTPGSESRGPGSLRRAVQGYGDILGMLFDLELSESNRARLFEQMRRDLQDFGDAHFAGGAAGWGAAAHAARDA